jgi:isopenicillin-N N-acyltransferase-like protein
MTLPVVELRGAPFEQGLRHGQVLKDRIGENLATYFRRFAREAGLSREEVSRRAGLYLAALEAQGPAYVANLRGVAAGSGFPLVDLAALNVRYELIYFETGRIALAEAASAVPPRPDGCTAFAIPPGRSASGHLLLGENWDWIPGVRGAILRTIEPDGLETVSFTEAGIVGGKIGLNSAGVGLAINGLSTAADDWSRLSPPFHLRCYEILRQRDLDGALRVVTEGDRACSAHFLLAQVPDRIVGVEAAPEATHLLRAAGCLVHANHFLDPAVLGVVETSAEDRAHSCHRQERLEALLAVSPAIRFDDVRAALCDHLGHPNSVCWHPDPAVPPDERYATVVSVLMDLTAATLDVSDGPPCEAPYQTVGLG